MSETAREISQEFWRPAQPPRSDYMAMNEAQCVTCGTEFAPGARFCHVCGNGREDEYQLTRSSKIAEALDFSNIRERMGMSTTSLVLTIIAAACVLATLLTGLIYSASTLTEWQAVQTWRIEWMLAALVSLVAAILLKDTPTKKV